MFERCSIKISREKMADFIQFMKATGKDKTFWEKVKAGIENDIDKSKLDALFKE